MDLSPSYELLTLLLAAAIRLSDLPGIHVSELPPVIPMPREELNRTVCAAAPARCMALVAAFDTREYRIIVDAALDLKEPLDNSFLLHEIVHVLQLKQSGTKQFTSCSAVVASEQQAYNAQNKYLREHGVVTQYGTSLRFTRCPT